MNIDIIREIQRAEEQATLILDKSRDDSKKILNDAVVKANDEYNRIIDLANEEYKKIVQDYENQGKNIAESSEMKCDVSKISNVSDNKKQLAINKIIQEIIIYGDS
ncbi:hypothetical protein [Candidatus Arthromitus sp. SFB-rat-Yit]|uniref:hypothetical protein n=1 Tax=Candidatus Arthromitus sp. SFB-rat-Yit TaxID=1041504 RepID=UPI000227A27A|nr:hypothetical protein [Candidatus Arthromitus sp. SFB-rat-Yit]BAK80809.1 V-type sodium ATP synthase subunit G [Candidatus Arthromitus sp. SFB-rat-Yit]